MIHYVARELRRAFARIPGKTTPTHSITVTLWGKSDCSLCDRAHAILEKLSADYPLVLTIRDITSDPVAFEKYRYVIPVVDIDGGRRYEGKIAEHWLRQGLDEVVTG